MSEALGTAPALGLEEQPNLYNGKTFNNEKEELNFLQRLQTAGALEGVKWQKELHFPRRQMLEQLKGDPYQGLTQDKIDRFNYLSKLQTKGGPEWTPDLQKEIAELYPLINRRN